MRVLIQMPKKCSSTFSSLHPLFPAKSNPTCRSPGALKERGTEVTFLLLAVETFRNLSSVLRCRLKWQRDSTSLGCLLATRAMTEAFPHVPSSRAARFLLSPEAGEDWKPSISLRYPCERMRNTPSFFSGLPPWWNSTVSPSQESCCATFLQNVPLEGFARGGCADVLGAPSR